MSIQHVLRLPNVARPVAALLVAAITLTHSWYAWADSMVQHGLAGESFGNMISPFTMPSMDDSGSMSLFPGTTNGIVISRDQLFPGAGQQNLGTYTSVYGSDAATINLGAEANGALAVEQSATGEAYRVVRGSVGLSRPSLNNDPLFGQTSNIFGSLDLIKNDFGSCSVKTEFTEGEKLVHMPDYKQCQSINDKTTRCELRHSFEIGVIKHHSGPLNLSNCGEGCVDVWIGTIGDNYWNGNCSVFEEQITLEMMNPDAIYSARIEYAKWDDHMQIWLGGEKVWSGPEAAFPPETPGTCELDTSWETSPGADVTGSFKRTGLLTAKIRVSVTGAGEGYAKIRVLYDPKRIVKSSELGPPACLSALNAVTDGFCQAKYQCKAGSPAADENGCGVVDGLKVCPEHFPVPLPPGFPALCEVADVDVDCDFWNGEMDCWTDPQGVQHCPTVETEELSNCAEYENDPNCGFITSRCVGEASGKSGTCYVKEDVWDCGAKQAVPTLTKDESYACAGPVRCMGYECLTATPGETNDDFYKAVSGLQAAQYMAMDANCTDPQDTGTSATCEVFKGKKSECKKAFGSYVDCCNQAIPDVSLANYIGMIMAVSKIDSAVMSLNSSNAVRGAWQSLRDPIVDGWTEVTKPLTQAWDSIWNSSSAVTEGAQMGIITQIEQALMEEAAKFIADTFGHQAANSLFVVAGEGGTSAAFAADGAMNEGLISLGGELGSLLGGVMMAYAIYSIVTTLIKIIWACTQEEFELQMQKQLKNCTPVGSYCAGNAGVCIEVRQVYCCFNSPLSRILQEQIRPQLGMTWGDKPQNAECNGLEPHQLTAVDWDKVDLSEWLGILSSTGHLPEAGNMQEDLLTRFNEFNYDGTRMSVGDRTKTRIEGIDVTTIRTNAGQDLRGVVVPKP